MCVCMCVCVQTPEQHTEQQPVEFHAEAPADEKQSREIVEFSIRHYAGEVTYNAENFLVKNSDSVEFDNLIIWTASSSEVSSAILRLNADGTMKNKADVKRDQMRAFFSMGSIFSDQLSALMAVLKKTSPYFVRCIKPNGEKKPKYFIPDFVRLQLRCGGLIEALRIIKLGFPTRCNYARVWELFGSCLGRRPPANVNNRDFTRAIMAVLGDKSVKLTASEYQFGLSMLFFRPGKQTHLTDILDKKTVTAEQAKTIGRILNKKRFKRIIATGKAWIRTGKMLQEMRFRKAALGMLIIYRVFGRALTNAKDQISPKRDAAGSQRTMQDAKLQEALEAHGAVKRMQDVQKKLEEDLKKQEAEALKKAQEAARLLAAKEADVEAAKQQTANQAQIIAELRITLAETKQALSASQELCDNLKRDVAKLREQLQQEKDSNEAKIAAKQKELAEQRAAADTARTEAADLRGQLAETEKKRIVAATKEQEEHAKPWLQISPWKWTHEQVMVWLEVCEWESKRQKQRVIKVFQEEGIQGTALKRLAESDAITAVRLLSSWGVENEFDRDALVTAIRALFSTSVNQSVASQLPPSVSVQDVTVSKLQQKGIKITSIIKCKSPPVHLCSFWIAVNSCSQ